MLLRCAKRYAAKPPGSRSAHPATRCFPAIARLPPDDATRRDLDRVAAVRQLDRRGSFVGFERRFPPPWTTEETDGCFIVKDWNGQKLAYADERPHTYSPATRHGAHSRQRRQAAGAAEPVSEDKRGATVGAAHSQCPRPKGSIALPAFSEIKRPPN
jgi:hypothetical protein